MLEGTAGDMKTLRYKNKNRPSGRLDKSIFGGYTEK